jgi:hypothetical protein
MSLRLFYLIFNRLLDWLMLLSSTTSSKDIELLVSYATKSPNSAEPTPSRAWTGPTEPCSPR